jgi:hypothetical protein
VKLAYGLRALALGALRVVEVLEMLGGQPAQLDMTQSRDDVPPDLTRILDRA